MLRFPLLFLFLFTVSNTAFSNTETLTGTAQPSSIEPNLISYFNSQYLGDDYISLVSVSNNQGFEEQDVIITLGAPDFFSKTSFTLPINGWVVQSYIYKHENSLNVRLILQGAISSSNPDSVGDFNEYTITILEDPNNDTQYSNTATVNKD